METRGVERRRTRRLAVVAGVILLLVAVSLFVLLYGSVRRGHPLGSDGRIRAALIETVPAVFADAPWYGSLRWEDGALELDADEGTVEVSTTLAASDTATAMMICHAILAVAYDPHDPSSLGIKGVEVFPGGPGGPILDCKP